MDRLPAEIQHLICVHAKNGGNSSDDLRSLSLLNHAWSKAAVPLIFETLVIKFFDYASLTHAVSEVKQPYFAHARRLDLIALPPIQRTYFDNSGDQTSLVLRQTRDWSISMNDFIPLTVGEFLELDLLHWCERGLNKALVRDPEYYAEKKWDPLVQLLEKLHHLAELNFAVENQFPKCLLQTIHDRHPRCRLSVWGLQRLSLQEPGLDRSHRTDWPQWKDPFEMDLLRSPCLRGLYILNHEAYKSGYDGQLEMEPVLPLISMAPNLKHIALEIGTDEFEDLVQWNERWEVHMKAVKASRPANPVSLYVRGPVTPDVLLRLTTSADLSDVSCVYIMHPAQLPNFRPVLSRFENLQHLVLDLKPIGPRPPSYIDEVESLFNELKPLKYLRIQGTRNISFIHRILAHHGPTLQGFVIEPYYKDYSEEHHNHPIFTPRDLKLCAQLCPRLRNLRVPLCRSKGDSHECDLYKALGSFSHLHSLVLDLDCDPDPGPADELLSVPDVLVNAAMDDALACGIWDCVAQSQSSRQLQRLRINVFGGMRRTPSVRHMLWLLSRSFLVTRAGTYESPRCLAREIGSEQRQALPQQVAIAQHSKVPKVSKYLQEVIGSLWPSSSESANWESSWKSWPLHSDHGK